MGKKPTAHLAAFATDCRGTDALKYLKISERVNLTHQYIPSSEIQKWFENSQAWIENMYFIIWPQMQAGKCPYVGLARYSKLGEKKFYKNCKLIESKSMLPFYITILPWSGKIADNKFIQIDIFVVWSIVSDIVHSSVTKACRGNWKEYCFQFRIATFLWDHAILPWTHGSSPLDIFWRPNFLAQSGHSRSAPTALWKGR